MANVLGIEITERSLRGALVRISARKREALRYLEVPITPLGEQGSRQAAIAGAFRELMESLGTSIPDAVHVALAGQHVSLRTVRIPEAAAKRAIEVLPFELEQQLPFPVEDVVIDYQRVSTRAGELTLLAVAVPEEVVERELSELAEADIDPRELVPGATSLDGLSVPGGVEGEAWLVAHVEDDFTDLCVMRDGHCELARTLDEGLRAAQTSPGTLRMSLVQTVSMYRAEGGPALAGLVVSGSGGEQERFVHWLGDLLQLPAEAAALPPVEGSDPPGAGFGKAYSLAARAGRRERRLNLRQGRFAANRSEGLLARHAGLLATCAAALVLAYVFSVWAEYSVVADERDSLAEQLEDKTKKRLGEGTRSARRARELLDRVGKTDDPLPEFDAVQALGVISDAISSDITHDTRKLEIQLDDGGGDGQFEINGSVPDLASRDAIASALEAHKCIGELERGKTSSLPGKDVKTYVLEGTLSCSGTKPAADKKTKGRKARGGKG